MLFTFSFSLQMQKIIYFYYYFTLSSNSVKQCFSKWEGSWIFINVIFVFFQRQWDRQPATCYFRNEVLSWPDLRLGFTLSGECECQAGDLEIYIFSTSIINPFPHSVIYFFVNYEGTMNWARMIHLMLQSSMTVVGLKILKLLVAQPAFMSLMTKTDVISHSY